MRTDCDAACRGRAGLSSWRMFAFAIRKSLISMGWEIAVCTAGLLDGLARHWRGWRLEVLDAEGTKQGSGALRATGNGTLSGLLAEIDVNDADGCDGV